MEASAAIRMGTRHNIPSLATFILEVEMFKRLGLRREDLLNRPAQEIKDYMFFIELIQREEQAQQQRQNQPKSPGQPRV